jgi:hypothetical protein
MLSVPAQYLFLYKPYLAVAGFAPLLISEFVYPDTSRSPGVLLLSHYYSCRPLAGLLGPLLRTSGKHIMSSISVHLTSLQAQQYSVLTFLDRPFMQHFLVTIRELTRLSFSSHSAQ